MPVCVVIVHEIWFQFFFFTLLARGPEWTLLKVCCLFYAIFVVLTIEYPLGTEHVNRWSTYFSLSAYALKIILIPH